MSNNCLVISYQKTVQDDNLLKLGECKVKIKNTGSAYYSSLMTLLSGNMFSAQIQFSQSVNYVINGTVGSGDTVNVIYGVVMTLDFQVPANTELIISLPKYFLYELDTNHSGSEVTFIGLNNTILYKINIAGNIVSGLSLDDLANDKLQEILGAAGRLSEGNIECLSVSSVLKKVGLASNNILGDIVTGLINSKGITHLEIQNTSISGSLNALFDAWAAAGKTGDMLLSFNGSNCTLTGVTTYADNKVTFSGGSWSVSQWS